ncbi:DUF2637 domain-containing protein [Micromonospora globbae]|uniref:DUF2637 domain-containing protein n=1 Tax=Micromonospora globbae TaxID=1894969 RepID=A0ABZ1SIF8_9ACTN|nr:DUF2637 domain-containing protein [Micromonospora globbae]
MTGKQLRRLRWAVRATLTLGVAASVAANVLHARPNPISQVIAAWPPLALLLTVELISRVPHHRWYLGAIRVTAAAVIAIIAAWVSYWHLVGVAARYGESGYGAAYLLPISVDGLVVVASVSLVEITARIRATSAPTTATEQATALAPAALDSLSAAVGHVPSPPESNEVTVAASPADQHPLGAEHTAALTTSTRPSILTPHAATPPGPRTSVSGVGGDGDDGPAPSPRPGTEQRSPGPVTAAGAGNAMIDLRVGALNETAAPAAKTTDPMPSEVMLQVLAATDAGLPKTPELRTGVGPAAGASDYERVDPPDGAPITADTAAAVAYWRRRDPAAKPAEVAARIGRSERTVRRHWEQRATTHAGRRNGHPATPRH